MCAGETVCPPRRLRQSVPRRARHDVFDRGLETHAVADRNLDWLHARARAQDRPDAIPAVH
jgi:hypothetical protein